MYKITQRQLTNIMQLNNIVMNVGLPYLEIRHNVTKEILCDVWETAKSDTMDYELFTNDERVLKAAGIETNAERIARRIKEMKAA